MSRLKLIFVYKGNRGWLHEQTCVLLQAEYRTLRCEALKLREPSLLFNDRILLEGPLSCERDQNVDVSDLWLDL
jgi:hypothetical protein